MTIINLKSIRDNTSKVLSEKNIPMHPNLPLLEQGNFKSAAEIGQRIVVLYSLAGLANGAAGDLLKEWLIDENAWGFLSGIEQEQLISVNLTQKELNELSWKQESLSVLCWCVLLVDDLVWPSSEANLSKIFPHIPPEIPISNFVDSLELRTEDQIIQMLDLYYCLHAALMHPELWKGEEVVSQLKIEVILERRHALEWVCSKPVHWDEINLDT